MFLLSQFIVSPSGGSAVWAV